MDAKNGGKKPAIAIDQVPLEWCFQPGVKLDFRHLADGYVVTAADAGWTRAVAIFDNALMAGS